MTLAVCKTLQEQRPFYFQFPKLFPYWCLATLVVINKRHLQGLKINKGSMAQVQSKSFVSVDKNVTCPILLKVEFPTWWSKNVRSSCKKQLKWIENYISNVWLNMPMMFTAVIEKNYRRKKAIQQKHCSVKTIYCYIIAYAFQSLKDIHYHLKYWGH